MFSDTRRQVDIRRRETVFDGYFQVDRYTLTHELHDGGQSAEITREVFERGHVVALLAVDLDREELVLIEQFRPGALAAHWEPWLYECVAGVSEKGEQPEQVAARECVEETGLQPSRVEFICRYLTSPGACSETVHLYVAEVDTRAAGGVHGLVSEGEDIRVHVVKIDEAFARLRNGDIVNSKTIIALQWLMLHYEDLRSRWAIVDSSSSDPSART